MALSPSPVTLSSVDIQGAQSINADFFRFYGNGGIGHLPNPIFEDQKTTDEYVARRLLYPSFSLKEYYEDEKHSPYYQNNQNRALTMTQQFGALSQQGVRLIGQEKNGKYSMYAVTPDPSGSVSLYSSTQETGALLWVIIGIGAIALLANTVA